MTKRYNEKGSARLVSDIGRLSKKHRWGVVSIYDNTTHFKLEKNLPKLIEAAEKLNVQGCHKIKKRIYRPWAKLLELRYGLNKDGKKVPFDVIAEKEGISKERMRQVFLGIFEGLYDVLNCDLTQGRYEK